MATESASGRFTIILYGLCVALLFTVLRGYAFNTGDQGEHLPQVYQLFDPQLYQGDFFMEMNAQTFSIRYFWVHLVYAVALLTGVPAACFILHLFSLSALMIALVKLSFYFTADKEAAYLSPVLATLVFHQFTLGGNTLADTMFVGSSPAVALAAWGMYHWLRRRRYVGAVLMGCSIWFQALIGLQLTAVLVCLHFFHSYTYKDIRNSILAFLIFLAIASPMLYPLFVRHINNQEESYRLLFIHRAPWHYISHLFNPSDFIRFTLLLLMALTGIRYLQPNARRRELLLFVAIITFGCLVYSIMVDVFEQYGVCRTQWYKTTVWLAWCGSMVIANALVNRFKLVRRFVGYISCNNKLIGLGIAGSAFVVLCSSWIPVPQLQGRYQIGWYKQTDLQRMHEWIRTQTPKQASFIFPPDDESFTCESQRPSPVNYKSLIHEPFYILPWRERLEQYYHTGPLLSMAGPIRHELVTGYYAVPQDSGMVDYAEYDSTLLEFPLNPSSVVHQEGQWVLVRYGDKR